jgi:hypothetical protein
MDNTYSEIVFRTGGWLAFRWQVTVPFPKGDEDVCVDSLKRAGYHCFVRPAGTTQRIGLPSTWDHTE